MTISKIDEYAMAATFAEAGEHETAREILAGIKAPQKEPVKVQQTKKPYLLALVFGCISLAAYFYVFTNEKLVTDVFTRGGAYAAWPIGTALFFSFVHGAFGSNLLTIVGLEAKKK